MLLRRQTITGNNAHYLAPCGRPEIGNYQMAGDELGGRQLHILHRHILFPRLLSDQPPKIFCAIRRATNLQRNEMVFLIVPQSLVGIAVQPNLPHFEVTLELLRWTHGFELTSRVVYEQFDGGRFQAAIFC